MVFKASYPFLRVFFVGGSVVHVISSTKKFHLLYQGLFCLFFTTWFKHHIIEETFNDTSSNFSPGRMCLFYVSEWCVEK